MKKLLLSGLTKTKGLIEEIEARIKEEPAAEASDKVPPTSPPGNQHVAPQQAEQAALPPS